jgi:hypothetical protein
MANQETISKYLLSFEIGFLALPITLLYFVGSYSILITTIQFPSWEKITISSLVILCGFSIYSLWFVSYIVLFKREAIKSINSWYWFFTFVGTTIGILSFISSKIPIVEDYSGLYYFRQDFNNFIFGLPLSIVALHAFYESKN